MALVKPADITIGYMDASIWKIDNILSLFFDVHLSVIENGSVDSFHKWNLKFPDHLYHVLHIHIDEVYKTGTACSNKLKSPVLKT